MSESNRPPEGVEPQKHITDYQQAPSWASREQLDRRAFGWFKPKPIDYDALARDDRNAKMRNAAIMLATLGVLFFFRSNIIALFRVDGPATTVAVSRTPVPTVEGLRRKVEAAFKKPNAAPRVVVATAPTATASPGPNAVSSTIGQAMSAEAIAQLRQSQRAKMVGYKLANVPASATPVRATATGLARVAVVATPAPKPSALATVVRAVALKAATAPPSATPVLRVVALRQAPPIQSYTTDFTYTGRWENVTGIFDGRKDGQSHRSFSPESRAVLNFRGTAVKLLGVTGVKGGWAAVRVDDRPARRISFKSPSKRVQTVVYETTGLLNTGHTLVVSVEPAEANGYVNIEGAKVTR